VTSQVPSELAVKLFRALYADFDLVAADDVIMAIPVDGSIPVFTDSTLSGLSLQIAAHREGR